MACLLLMVRHKCHTRCAAAACLHIYCGAQLPRHQPADCTQQESSVMHWGGLLKEMVPMLSVGTSQRYKYCRVCRYGGGRAGLSDTCAATMWQLDALPEFAKAGAGGFHCHWGIGGAPDGTMGQPNTGVQTNFFYRVGDKRLEYKELKRQGVSYEVMVDVLVCHLDAK
eukprot:GHRQ01032382.1.p1 GENE.GHRQ01032382.1~~GHRQ01032382.1.p1  ORF type:complete len:168 (-),score=31.09 GHRQ01032382.1:140-643(-)